MNMMTNVFEKLIDFTRTSAGGYYGPDGLFRMTPASKNLLTYTQEFDNAAWAKLNATVTANSVAAPDGTMTADAVLPTATTAWHNVQQSGGVSGTPMTLSVYAKAGSHAFMQLSHGSLSSIYANFNLLTGEVGTVGANATASITPAGDGWYRCAMTFTPGGAGSHAIGHITSATAVYRESWASTGTESIYLWGAQLEVVPDANLVLGSELGSNGDFASGSTGWTLGSGVTISGGAAQFASVSSGVGISQTVSPAFSTSSVYRVSVTISGYTAGTLSVRCGSGGAFNALPAANGTHTITVIGGAANGILQFFSSAAPASFTIDNITVKEITGMPTTYTRNVGGLYPPRFDYDPETKAPRGLLVEEQQTNLLTYSEQFDNAAWVKTRASISANATTSPDGTVDAAALVEDGTATQTHLTYRSVTIDTAKTYTASVYLKADTRTFARFLLGDTGGENAVRVDVNLTNGAISTGTNGTGWTLISASAAAVGNGWYRVVVTGTSAASTTGTIVVYMATALGTITYTGDGTSRLFVYGAQLEAGAFATSYIPTAASQVTRAADNAVITGANFSRWYNQSEGTFVVEADTVKPTTSATPVVPVSVSGNGGVTANSVNVRFVGSKVDVTCYADSSLVVDANGFDYTPGNTTKSALALKANDFALAVSGSSPEVDTNAAVPVVSQMFVGQASNGSQINGHIRSIKYYPTRLGNAQLQTLSA